MSAQNEIDNYELKLESLIKNAFIKKLKIVDEFEIYVDHDSERRINDVVRGLGLVVYGMGFTRSEFTITFEFNGPYQNMECLERPTYCHIRLANKAEYNIYIWEYNLKDNWHLNITDDNFNIKSLSEETIRETLNEMNQVMILTVLSN
jgi:hypothetical protein